MLQVKIVLTGPGGFQKNCKKSKNAVLASTRAKQSNNKSTEYFEQDFEQMIGSTNILKKKPSKHVI